MNSADDFVSEFSPDLSQLLFSSFSDGANLAMDPSGSIYVSGTAQYTTSVYKNGGYGSWSTAVSGEDRPRERPASDCQLNWADLECGSNPAARSVTESRPVN